jgi:hypothetical protein
MPMTEPMPDEGEHCQEVRALHHPSQQDELWPAADHADGQSFLLGAVRAVGDK